jgi:hypothetical protein
MRTGSEGVFSIAIQRDTAIIFISRENRAKGGR